MPGLLQAAKHVAGPKEQSRRPLEQLRSSGKDRKGMAPCSRDRKAQSRGLGTHSQCSLSENSLNSLLLLSGLPMIPTPTPSMAYYSPRILPLSSGWGVPLRAKNSLQLLCAWFLYSKITVIYFMVNTAISSDTWHADFGVFWRGLFNCEPPWDVWNRIDFSQIQFMFKYFRTQLLGKVRYTGFLFNV